MINIQTDVIKGYRDIHIPFTILSKNEESRSIAILLPGAGYTAQAPLFHYATGVFLNKGFDVLQVNYRYNDKIYDKFSMNEIQEVIQFDVNAVLDSVLALKSYNHGYVIGKSLGTMAIGSVLNRKDLIKAKAVWLTPLINRDDLLNTMARSQNEGLCIIGDKDRYYVEERYKKIIDNPNITSIVIPNVNHSLEYDDNAVDSVDVLKSVIKEIQQF
ncbi:alpha/beta hydrolase family protein [Peribacillus sp. SCS-37]|uniref:alpha/beta hydrolase family protein n=1 Tax=Paraperibacillus esterisolvens TaxID=3115296 RepID=UPI00390627E8